MLLLVNRLYWTLRNLVYWPLAGKSVFSGKIIKVIPLKDFVVFWFSVFFVLFFDSNVEKVIWYRKKKPV